MEDVRLEPMIHKTDTPIEGNSYYSDGFQIIACHPTPYDETCLLTESRIYGATEEEVQEKLSEWLYRNFGKFFHFFSG